VAGYFQVTARIPDDAAAGDAVPIVLMVDASVIIEPRGAGLASAFGVRSAFRTAAAPVPLESCVKIPGAAVATGSKIVLVALP
jgi:hypothetical protein